MKKAGMNTATLGVFAWAKYEPREGEYDFTWLRETMDRLYAAGIYTELATPCGAKPNWMAKKYPEILRVQSDGGKARVSVENTGPTIDKDELPLLFDRFHKADKSRSADREGWGLGLYIAKTIVGAHGGDIWATSENGVTQFNFTLPAVR